MVGPDDPELVQCIEAKTISSPGESENSFGKVRNRRRPHVRLGICCYEENEGELRRVHLLFERTTTGTSSIVDSSGALKSLTHLHFFSALVRKLL